MEGFEKVRANAITGIHKAKKAAQLFGDGFREGANSDFDIGVSAASGIWSGLKYGGSLKRGVKAGAVTYLSLRVVNGIRNVARKWHEVKWEI